MIMMQMVQLSNDKSCNKRIIKKNADPYKSVISAASFEII